MKTKTMALDVLGVSLVLIMLMCAIGSDILPVSAQNDQFWGRVSMWTTQRYYPYGQEIYLIILAEAPMHRARLEIRQWGGPSYRMDIGHLWPGQQYMLDVGQSAPPAGRVMFTLYEGWQRVAETSCGTGP
jgi:hypothetical protein